MNIFDKPFIWANKEHFLSLLPHRANVEFALFCANQVKHLLTDERSFKALEIAQDWLDGKATQEECRAAAYAAYTTAHATNAAYATANAANAAAAYAAYATAHANAAANAAAHVYVAITAEEIKQEQMNYLRELILANLSEEDRECWLLVASL